MLADLFPRDKLTRAVSIFTTGAMMGTGIAFLFGAGLLSAFSKHPGMELPFLGAVHSWQVAFLIAGAPGLILSLMMLTVREPDRSRAPGESATWAALAQFFKRNWLLLSLHFSGFSFLGMALYGFMTWAPALLTRHYGLRPSVIGISMGVGLSVFGIAGLITGGALADHWLRLGQADAHMRVGLVGMTIAIPFALMLSLSTNLIVGVIGLSGLFFSLLLPGAAGPAGLQLVTPPLLRGRLSALFMMVINLMGLGLGPLSVGVFTDQVFHNPLAVGLSLCLLTVLVMPLAIVVFGVARKPFAASVRAERQEVLVSAAS
jgi:MFS family permease